MSTWPLISDFSRMLKTPKFAFRDPQLRDCRIEMDQLGQPKARSGNFATVFRATQPDGSEFAVRVFNRSGDERRERYQQVHEYVENRPISSLVRFHYDEKGIRSAGDGKLYPLVTMEWVPGVTLFEWVRDRCRERYSQALTIAADVWLQLVRELAANNVVHGDLQHANVMVSSEGHFKLVDYDGMCAPSLIGRRNLEIGMAPYQHPGRNDNTVLYEGLDNFSALFIYVTLRALAAAPHLWLAYVDNTGYDKLLIKPEDFEAPQQSRLAYELMRSPDEQVRDLTHYLFELRKYDLHQVPPIDEVLLWCNSLEQLLSRRDWETAVELVKRMAPGEQIPHHLQPLLAQAHQRVACKQALEQALAAGNEYEAQRLYIPELLDDYPAAAALVQQARQAGHVQQVLGVLHAALQQGAWRMLVDTWQANEGVLDKRASAMGIKPEVKKIVACDTLMKLLDDPNSDDKQVLETWDAIEQAGGHPLAAPLVPHVQRRRRRLKALGYLKDAVENAERQTTLANDREVVQSWEKNLFDGWDAIPRFKQTYRAAVKRVKRLQEIYRLDKKTSLEGEQRIVELWEELPEGYHPETEGRVRRATTRLKAYDQFRTAMKKAKSDREILAAADVLRRAKAEDLVAGEARDRLDAARRRYEKLEALRKISNADPPPEIDRRLLEIWDEDLFFDCRAADPWRQRVDEARRRADVLRRLRAAVEANDAVAVAELATDRSLKGYPLGEELADKVEELRREADHARQTLRRDLIRSMTSGDRKTFHQLFDANTLRDLCEQFPHHRPLVCQWMDAEVLPLSMSGLGLPDETMAELPPAPEPAETPAEPSEKEPAADAKSDEEAEEGDKKDGKKKKKKKEEPPPEPQPVIPPALERISEEQFRARWKWPPPKITDRCRLAVFQEKPKPGANLADIDNHMVISITRDVWAAAGARRDFVVHPEWDGCYVYTWAVIDLGFQVFESEPLELGQITLHEEKKKSRWSLFRRKEE